MVKYLFNTFIVEILILRCIFLNYFLALSSLWEVGIDLHIRRFTRRGDQVWTLIYGNGVWVLTIVCTRSITIYSAWVRVRSHRVEIIAKQWGATTANPNKVIDSEYDKRKPVVSTVRCVDTTADYDVYDMGTNCVHAA